ncbi:CLUMA_CG005393, isoform A [Clunio marinus]|uniref:CLUMA_CG005393, isoform A n=1 Tax=Clunio marinus TaxID=568069 RepID=A0A1J1HUL3_9DIPT|nr:CLUMA_CG005393, isoform A [Clunio marinus]
MKLNTISILMLMLCGFLINLTIGKERRTAQSRTTRADNEFKVEEIAKRLEATIWSIEDKINKKIDENIGKFTTRINELEGRINEILSNKINDVLIPIFDAKFMSIYEKLSKDEINVSNQIIQNQNRCKDEVIKQINVHNNDLNQGNIHEAVASSEEEKHREDLTEINEKLEHLKYYLQYVFDEDKNISREIPPKHIKIQKKERVDNNQTGLINEVLSMVMDKIKNKGTEKIEDKNCTKPQNSPMSDIVSNFENMKRIMIIATTNKTNSSMKNSRIVYPDIKNKPSMLNTSFFTDSLRNKDIKGFSCVELMNIGMRQSGVYYLQIHGTTFWFLKVFCEQEIADGGWTVIQRRDYFGEPKENFNRDWADYKKGFGNPAKEFWMGNENIFMLTNNEEYALRIELEDFEGNKRYAEYSRFKIHSEADYYKLEVYGYEGNAGDSFNDLTYGANNSPFSTYNRDNDRSSLNCASMLKGGWWWKSCGRGLNGLYLRDPFDDSAKQGIIWFTWKGWDYTLKKSTMMVKPLAKIIN